MRWSSDITIPENGTLRVKRRFLWLPKTIVHTLGDRHTVIKITETRFWSVESWEEKFVHGKLEKFWKAQRWIDDE
jgi:hypothetical protein